MKMQIARVTTVITFAATILAITGCGKQQSAQKAAFVPKTERVKSKVRVIETRCGINDKGQYVVTFYLQDIKVEGIRLICYAYYDDIVEGEKVYKVLYLCSGKHTNIVMDVQTAERILDVPNATMKDARANKEDRIVTKIVTVQGLPLPDYAIKRKALLDRL